VYLFQVSRWGNDDSPDGPDGEDTHFLVVANDYLDAAALVDEKLKTLPHERVRDHCNVVSQLGLDQGTAEQPMIVCGPWYQFCHNGKLYPNYWTRDHVEDGWTSHEAL
jgi:hypothetical protein